MNVHSGHKSNNHFLEVGGVGDTKADESLDYHDLERMMKNSREKNHYSYEN